jgi:hypothetical protein
MQNLPLDKQQIMLELSAFLKQKSQENQIENITEPFGERLKKFLKEVESDPIDVDTSSFDSYRKSITTREFKWED